MTINNHHQTEPLPIDTGTNYLNVFAADKEDDELDTEEVRIDKEMELHNNLKRWAVQNRITHTKLRGLIKVLNDYAGNILPSDPRTFLHSSEEVIISKIGNDGGEYWHNGLEKNIRKIFEGLTEPKTISININIPTFI